MILFFADEEGQNRHLLSKGVGKELWCAYSFGRTPGFSGRVLAVGSSAFYLLLPEATSQQDAPRRVRYRDIFSVELRSPDLTLRERLVEAFTYRPSFTELELRYGPERTDLRWQPPRPTNRLLLTQTASVNAYGPQR